MGQRRKKKAKKGSGATSGAQSGGGVSVGTILAVGAVLVAVILAVRMGGPSSTNATDSSSSGSSGRRTTKKRTTGGGPLKYGMFGVDRPVEIDTSGPGEVGEHEHLARVARLAEVRQEWIKSQAYHPDTGWTRSKPYYMIENGEPIFDTHGMLQSAIAPGSKVREVYGDKFTVVSDSDPIMFIIDDFLTPAECERIIYQAQTMGLKRSTTTGHLAEGQFERPVSDIRTSSNAWCTGSCYEDPVIVRVSERISNITGHIPRVNAEHFQLLHYGPTEEYQGHSDYIVDQARAPGGIRILTAYIYLNTVGEGGGGETAFPDVGVTVTPKAGRLVVWPNVAPGTYRENKYTRHAALPVKEGHEKYGGNIWVHAHSFVDPWSQGITG